uniref:exodeoxyribonuclease III n=1 Tax=Astyanax mexicanus TaxID=7994 RepID=A0A3B1IXT6_ASTMX
MSLNSLIIASSNVRSIQSQNFRKNKLMKLKREKIDILCIQETRLASFSDASNAQRIWGEEISIFSVGPDIADGVAILFYTRQIQICKKREPFPGRLLYVDVYIKNIKCRIINVYAPHNSKKKIELFKTLKKLLYVGFPVVICGDFNTITEGKDTTFKPFKMSKDALLKSTTISLVLSTLRDRLLVLHQSVSHCTSSLYADSSFLLMRPTTVVSSANLMMWFELYFAVQS